MGVTHGIDLCTVGNVFPINHLDGQKYFPGDFTYYKGEKKSQIYFVYTNKDGLKYIKDFYIPTDDWPVSDHRPVAIDLFAPKP